MLATYEEILKTYEKEYIIEKIETGGKPGLEHYFPHRAKIKNEYGKKKTCIVFDASSKIGNTPCLFGCLHASPCLLPLVFDILLRFRIGDEGLVAHLKQAFLNKEIDKAIISCRTH